MLHAVADKRILKYFLGHVDKAFDSVYTIHIIKTAIHERGVVMVFDKSIVGVAEIAEVLNVNKNVVSNWISRDSKFPIPYTKNAAGPLWWAGEIAEYASTRGYEVVALPGTQGKTGKIAVLGRARLGKSFFISILAKNRQEYVTVFCSNGKDKTVCPIQNIFIDAEFKEYFEFHSDFNSIYEAEEENEELNELKEAVSSILKKQYYFDGDDASGEIRKIEGIVRRMREMEGRYPGRKGSDTYISVYLQPCNFLKGIMREASLRRLEVMDTPGVSGKVVATKLSKADLYILILRPDNGEEAQTLKGIVEELKPYTASSKVIFMFKKEAVIQTKTKYEQRRMEAKRSMSEFEGLFSELKGLIINTDSEILNLAENTVMFPTMDEEESTLSEELFLEELRDRFRAAFIEGEAEQQEKRRFQEVVSKHGKDAADYVLNLLKGIPKHGLGSGGEEYTLERFRSEEHDRVMTSDNYRIHKNLSDAYEKEVKLLDAYFSRFTVDNISDEWKQDVIQYIYRVISKSVRQDRGIGIGAHPWEENPARTMLVEESVNAETVYDYVEGEEEKKVTFAYKTALQDAGVLSNSWPYVGVSRDEENMKKLEIIKDTLCGIRVSDREELILCRHVGGLRKMAEFHILKEAGYGDKECRSILAELPF